MKLSFIGTGSMGSAILRAVCGSVDPADITITNRTVSKAEMLAMKLGCEATGTNIECAKGADYIFLGVKPDTVCTVLQEIAPALTGEETIVSMAAGVSGQTMHHALGKENPIIRILPNTPCAIGRGLMLIAPCSAAAAEKREELARILAPCGRVAFTDEAHADAGMVIGGCTPAFTYLFIEALSDGAVASGLSRADAIAWAAQAVAGAAELVLQSGQHPAALKDAVCSPAGSTIEGVRALERSAFRAAAMDAVSAAYAKTAVLGRDEGR